MDTFADQVEQEIRDFTRQNPMDPKANPAESVWGFGFTKSAGRKMPSL